MLSGYLIEWGLYSNLLPLEKKSMCEMYACIIPCSTSEVLITARTKQCGVIAE